MIRKSESEGGCGVIGVASSEKIQAKHLLKALEQMRNRGNGKGGGIAVIGLRPENLGVTQEILERDYILAIGYLDLNCRSDVEEKFIHPIFKIDHIHKMETLHAFPGLDVRPPEVLLYFVQVKGETKSDEQVVYQNSYQINTSFYQSKGDKKAFVLSHGKNLIVLKMVGFGDDVIRYYKLENFQAHVWIGHHRYPTKGNVWHPGGAHPFVGLNEALVHNGDFANYYSMVEYLGQHDIRPHFLTDTEVSALLFDLLMRTYQYPLEYVIEALAPTTERDFSLLPEKKQKIYQILQKMHMHGSPDGPWFFLIAQSLEKKYRLIGITDTSLLRPQVFALQKGEVSLGFAASEKQAIDATLKSLSCEDPRIWSCADYYWNARGGSHTDGGAFTFTVSENELVCTNKFGEHFLEEELPKPYLKKEPALLISLPNLSPLQFFEWAKNQILSWGYREVEGMLDALASNLLVYVEVTTLLMDHYYPLGTLRRSSLLALYNEHLSKVLEKVSSIGKIAVVDASKKDSEGKDSLSHEIVHLYKSGIKHFIVFNCRGQRFIGNGLGPHSKGVQIHVYGSSGDYLASGIDGAEIYVHGSAQDQLAQIMKGGLLVVYGDVGQTFMYGAKGGEAYILGNTAGRPLINAVGSPRVIINGTCLDYLAESFMAGNPLKEGGFVIVNGIQFEKDGRLVDLDNPYPGNNLFSLASGGCIYIRDPHQKVTKGQLNGGDFEELTKRDWDLIFPYLKKNCHFFNIPIEGLLGTRDFKKTYRKIVPSHAKILQEEEAWVKAKD